MPPKGSKRVTSALLATPNRPTRPLPTLNTPSSYYTYSKEPLVDNYKRYA